MDIRVSPQGWISWHDRRLPCRLGKTGCRQDKREGDGATPLGIWPLRRVLYRPDRLTVPPVTMLPLHPIAAHHGWCDDPVHGDYNRPVTLPHPARCEHLWRDDGVYDVVVVLGHNDDPPQPGAGSAIFMHVSRPDGSPTEGCIALPLPDLLALLADCDGQDRLLIGDDQAWR